MGRGMIDIDGSVKSGSGTILRYSLVLASLMKRDLHISNIRAKREKPGLRPQHLKVVEACCDLTGGSAHNAEVGSREITFRPGPFIRGGSYHWDIGTAGSTTMMAVCLLSLGCLAREPSIYTITGGLFQDFAPNAFHTRHVLLDLLRRFSIRADLHILRPGYYPQGGGSIKLEIHPARGKLTPVQLPEQGRIVSIRGVALSSHLREKRVGRRMAETCNNALAQSGYHADIEIIDDESAHQKGAALCVYAITDSGCIIGSDMAGKLGRSAESIGTAVAGNLLEDIRSGATVDRFAGDQLILYAALAEGESRYVIPAMNDHVDANLWLVQEILGAQASIQGRDLRIRGIGRGPG